MTFDERQNLRSAINTLEAQLASLKRSKVSAEMRVVALADRTREDFTQGELSRASARVATNARRIQFLTLAQNVLIGLLNEDEAGAASERRILALAEGAEDRS